MTFKMPVYSDEQVTTYIAACDAERIIVHCNTSDDAVRIVPLGFRKDEDRTGKIVLALRVADDAAKADVLTTLRDMGVPFGHAPAGWPPSAVFEHFRDRGLVHGPYKQIFWVTNSAADGGLMFRVTLDN